MQASTVIILTTLTLALLWSTHNAVNQFVVDTTVTRTEVANLVKSVEVLRLMVEIQNSTMTELYNSIMKDLLTIDNNGKIRSDRVINNTLSIFWTILIVAFVAAFVVTLIVVKCVNDGCDAIIESLSTHTRELMTAINKIDTHKTSVSTA